MLLNTEEADLLLIFRPSPVKDDPSIVFKEPPSKRPRVGYSMNVENLFASSIKADATRRPKQEV